MDPAAGTWIGGVVVDPPAGAGAREVPMAAAKAPGAVVVPVAVAAAPPAALPALNWKNLRRRWAQALLAFGCAAAALAFFSINSAPTVRRFLGGCACAPTTDAEAAALRAASEELLVLAAAQVLVATTALLVPARRQVAVFALYVGWETGYRAGRVLLMLFECHGRVDDVHASYYCFMVMVLVGYLVGAVVVDNSG